MNTTYDPITNSFVLDKGTDSILPQLVWVITDNCPNDCPFCFQPKTGMDFRVYSLAETMLLFKKLGVQKIDISGGEPLGYPSFQLICNTLRSKNIHFTLTTNGIGKEVDKKWLVTNCDMFSRVMLSINGFNESSHDTLCTVPGTYKDTIQIIQSLKQVGYNRIRINTVLTKTLVPQHNLEDYINIIESVQPLELCLIQAHPENKKSTFDLHNISSIEFESLSSEIRTRLKGTKVLIRTIENYRGYWVLYPNGIIRKHVDCPEDVVEYHFKVENLPSLIQNIAGTVWLPDKEKEA